MYNEELEKEEIETAAMIAAGLKPLDELKADPILQGNAFLGAAVKLHALATANGHDWPISLSGFLVKDGTVHRYGDGQGYLGDDYLHVTIYWQRQVYSLTRERVYMLIGLLECEPHELHDECMESYLTGQEWYADAGAIFRALQYEREDIFSAMEDLAAKIVAREPCKKELHEVYRIVGFVKPRSGDR